MNKTDDQLAREKAAVAAMQNAKSNMNDVLSRVNSLQTELLNACTVITRLKGHVGRDSKMNWHDGRQETTDYVTKYADAAIAKIHTVLA